MLARSTYSWEAPSGHGCNVAKEFVTEQLVQLLIKVSMLPLFNCLEFIISFSPQTDQKVLREFRLSACDCPKVKHQVPMAVWIWIWISQNLFDTLTIGYHTISPWLVISPYLTMNHL